MVYESRDAGDVITLGASSWRIEEITPDRVVVSPAPGEPGKLPFWHGDAVGRPIELGRALGAFVARAGGATSAAGRAAGRRALARLGERHDLDPLAAENLVAYLEDERERRRARCRPTGGSSSSASATSSATGGSCLLTPFGGRVHAPVGAGPRGAPAPSASAPRSRRSGRTTGSRSGCPTATSTGSTACSSRTPTRSRTSSSATVGDSALFAARFRENAARALLLPAAPARDPDAALAAAPAGRRPARGRQPLRQLPDPRRDVSRVPVRRVRPAGAARRPRAASRAARSRSTGSRRSGPRRSPSSLLFDYVAAYMYEGDAPLAERRAQALTLDRDLLRELLGQEELRELLDPAALGRPRARALQAPGRRAAGRRPPTSSHDLLRRLGDLTADEVAARCAAARPARARLARRRWPPAGARSRSGSAARRAGSRSRTPRATATPSASSRRRGRPARVPRADARRAGGSPRPLRPDPRPVPGARAGAPLGTPGRGRRGGARPARWRRARSCAASSGRAAPSASGATRTCCASSARRSLARLRREVEPVEPAALGPVPARRGRGSRRGAGSGDGRRRGGPPYRGSAALERLAEVVDQLAGVPIPASVLERDVLPARIPGYQPRLLDELGALGEVAWVGRGSARPRRRPDRAVPARARGAAARRAAVRGRSRRPPRNGRPARATRRSGSASAGAARRSIASSTRPPAVARTARCSTRCGTSSGPARSRTTRSPRSVPSAGRGRGARPRRAARPADEPRAARGGGSLVARRGPERG